MFHGLEAGVLPVYLGAPNVADFLPEGAALQRADVASASELADAMIGLARAPEAYARYFAWKRRPLAESFQQRWSALVHMHAKCRLCRWAYARRFGFRWDREAQEPDLSATTATARLRHPP